MSLSSHQSAKAITKTWLTPQHILAALPEFGLDPCAAPEPRPWTTALNHLTLPDDGLAADWGDHRVWLNPPFGDEAAAWLAKLADHGNGIALVPARTETKWFYAHIWGRADAVLFMRTRPYFHRPDGARGRSNSGAPICLVAYGIANVAALERSGLGIVLSIPRSRV